ncbi:hypothetical protein COX95_04630 [bacterium CG_4_10_14_0_2_um_filter_33_32]|nr:MAG: hypothetical protein COY76_00275 [bacterium CG_4_10_14_0_8_um_filter_33_57]PIZ85282.1 MAG: hypothetical protein COX95_04630 [bacterium CG_4_10_14_0_2_um_filter_33_32]
MMKKKVIIFLFSILFTAGLFSAGFLIFSQSNKKNEQKPEKKELNIYNWENYFAPETLSDFEKETGTKVNLSTFEDEEIMLSDVQSDPSMYDLIVASDEVFWRMNELKLLANVDKNNIPNLSNLHQKLFDKSTDAQHNFSIPYTWGTTGIIYNANFIKDNIKDWGDLWNPNYKGKIAMINNKFTIIACTLKYLGYHVASANESELTMAGNKLMEQKPLVYGYLDPMTIIEKIKNGDVWIGQLYNGDALMAIEENPDSNLKFILPESGSDFYIDAFAIPRDAKNKEVAEEFLDYILRPDVHSKIINYVRYASPLKKELIENKVDKVLLEDPLTYPSDEKVEGYGETSKGNNIRNKIWSELNK